MGPPATATTPKAHVHACACAHYGPHLAQSFDDLFRSPPLAPLVRQLLLEGKSKAGATGSPQAKLAHRGSRASLTEVADIVVALCSYGQYSHGLYSYGPI